MNKVFSFLFFVFLLEVCKYSASIGNLENNSNKSQRQETNINRPSIEDVPWERVRKVYIKGRVLSTETRVKKYCLHNKIYFHPDRHL